MIIAAIVISALAAAACVALGVLGQRAVRRCNAAVKRCDAAAVRCEDAVQRLGSVQLTVPVSGTPEFGKWFRKQIRIHGSNWR